MFETNFQPLSEAHKFSTDRANHFPGKNNKQRDFNLLSEYLRKSERISDSLYCNEARDLPAALGHEP